MPLVYAKGAIIPIYYLPIRPCKSPGELTSRGAKYTEIQFDNP